MVIPAAARKKMPVALQGVEGSDIQIPEDSGIAFVVSLEQTVESGDHYPYLCNIEKMAADESKEALFAWDGRKRGRIGR